MAEIKRDEDGKVIRIEEEHHVDMARRTAKECSVLMGFGEVKTALIATSVSELARNILVHAGKGTVVLRAISQEENPPLTPLWKRGAGGIFRGKKGIGDCLCRPGAGHRGY